MRATRIICMNYTQRDTPSLSRLCGKYIHSSFRVISTRAQFQRYYSIRNSAINDTRTLYVLQRNEWISFHSSCIVKKRKRKKNKEKRKEHTRTEYTYQPGRVYGTHRFQAISQVRPIVELFCCTWLDSE